MSELTRPKIGEIVRCNFFRDTKARHGVVVIVYKDGAEGTRVVLDTSPFYERIIAALLCNQVETLKPINAEIVQASVHLYPGEFTRIDGEIEVPS